MRYPWAAKLAAITLIVLLLAAALMRIDGLVFERRERQAQALQSVADSLSAAQTLVGPLLQRQCTEEWDRFEGEGRERRLVTDKREFTLHSTPRDLNVKTDARAEARYRGLFKVNGYASTVQLDAVWPDLADLRGTREQPNSRLRCANASLWVAVADPRGIRSAAVTIDHGQALPTRPGTGHAVHTRGLSAHLPDPRMAQVNEPLRVAVTLELAGTARLSLVPAAEQVRWTMSSDWPHPSFGGRFLPTARNVTPQGFAAEWGVSALASPAAAEIRKGEALCQVIDRPAEGQTANEGGAITLNHKAQGGACVDTIDVSFIDPVNPYSLTDRAIKYGLLFVALTFAAVGLTEVLARRRVHPMQYALVGLALVLFFLLMFSLSEHLPFERAYAAASTAAVLLLGYYGRHMLGSWVAGTAFGGGIALLYAALWTLLRMEQWSLAIGAVMLFVLLAVAMIATRRVDWYALAGSITRTETPPVATSTAQAAA